MSLPGRSMAQNAVPSIGPSRNTRHQTTSRDSQRFVQPLSGAIGGEDFVQEKNDFQAATFSRRVGTVFDDWCQPTLPPVPCQRGTGFHRILTRKTNSYWRYRAWKRSCATARFRNIGGGPPGGSPPGGPPRESPRGGLVNLWPQIQKSMIAF